MTFDPPKTEEEIAASFWAHVERGDGAACWLWKGAFNSDGYGVIRLTKRPRRHIRHEGAHRVSYRIHVGAIPAGLSILHSCDNPRCVNPAHLRAGTQADNVADRTARRRHARDLGTMNKTANTKLSHEDVAQMRALKGAERYADIGARFGVSTAQAWRAVNLPWGGM